MLAMIPDMCIRFQAKIRVATKEICRLMRKSRTSPPGRPLRGRHAAFPFSLIA
jgi:hypothetical protein